MSMSSLLIVGCPTHSLQAVYRKYNLWAVVEQVVTTFVGIGIDPEPKPCPSRGTLRSAHPTISSHEDAHRA